MKRFINIDQGHTLHYDLINESAGTQTLVLVNGSIFNFRQWDLILKAGIQPCLKKQYRILRYDYGGIGLSTTPASKWDLSDLADELVALLDALEISDAHFFGLSKGTCVLQMLAAKYPARVLSLGGYGWYYPCYSKLIEMNTILAKRLEAFKKLNEISADPLNRKSYRSLWKTVYREIIFQKRYQQMSLREKLFAKLLEHKLQSLMIPTPVKAMYDWFKYAVEEIPIVGQSFHQELSSINNIPCLIQHAKGDQVLPVGMARELHSALPDSHMIEYGDGYSHVSIGFKQRQAKTVIRDYADFLNTL